MARGQADAALISARGAEQAYRALTAEEPANVLVESKGGKLTLRLESQVAKRSHNIRALVSESRDSLHGTEVPDLKPDPDWTARFFEYAQDVSDDDVRSIWARILAGQVRSPGCVSMRSLSVLRDLSTSDAEFVREVFRYRLGNRISWWMVRLATDDGISGADLFCRLQDIGLAYPINAANMSGYLCLNENGEMELPNTDYVLICHGKPGDIIDDSSDHCMLNRPAVELAPFCGSKPHDRFLGVFAGVGDERSPGFSVDAAPLIDISFDDYRYDRSKTRRIEPIGS